MSDGRGGVTLARRNSDAATVFMGRYLETFVSPAFPDPIAGAYVRVVLDNEKKGPCSTSSPCGSDGVLSSGYRSKKRPRERGRGGTASSRGRVTIEQAFARTWLFEFQ